MDLIGFQKLSSSLSNNSTVVEIFEAYELSYGQWGIFLFAWASVHKVGMTIDNFVGRLTETKFQMYENLARTYQLSVQFFTSGL